MNELDAVRLFPYAEDCNHRTGYDADQVWPERHKLS